MSPPMVELLARAHIDDLRRQAAQRHLASRSRQPQAGVATLRLVRRTLRVTAVRSTGRGSSSRTLRGHGSAACCTA